MGNCIFGYPVFSDPSSVYAPTLSGGSWLATADVALANVQHRRMSKVARSSSAAAEHTRFEVDLQTARRVGVLAVPRHTLSSPSAKARFVGYNADNFYFIYEAGQDIAALGGTFARASIATYTDYLGVLRTAANGSARDAHFENGVRTLLYEGAARSNNLWYSEDLTQAAWVKSGSTIAANIATSPDNGVTMDILLETAANVEHYAEQVGTGWADNDVAALSAYVRPFGTPRDLYLSCVQKDNVTVKGIRVNPATGAVVAVDAGVTNVRVVPFAPGGVLLGYRASFAVSVGTGAAQPRLRMQPHNGSGVVYVGSASIGLGLWGVQMELGPAASSYIKTLGATATRAADTLKFPFPATAAQLALSGVTIYDDCYVTDASSLTNAIVIGNVGAGDADVLAS